MLPVSAVNLCTQLLSDYEAINKYNVDLGKLNAARESTQRTLDEINQKLETLRNTKQTFVDQSNTRKRKFKELLTAELDL